MSPRSLTLVQLRRVLAKVKAGPKDTCWPWQGATTPDGYGKARVDGTLRLVHRLLWEHEHGAIPQGKQLSPTCGMRHCCNLAHWEVKNPREVTLQGNGPTAKNARRQTCKRGHLLEGDNVIERKEKDGVRRRCRQCYKERKRKAYAEGKYR